MNAELNRKQKQVIDEYWKSIGPSPYPDGGTYAPISKQGLYDVARSILAASTPEPTPDELEVERQEFGPTGPFQKKRDAERTGNTLPPVDEKTDEQFFIEEAFDATVDVEREAEIQFQREGLPPLAGAASRPVLTDEKLTAIYKKWVAGPHGKLVVDVGGLIPYDCLELLRAVRDACSVPVRRVTDEMLQAILEEIARSFREVPLDKVNPAAVQEWVAITRAVRDACEGRKG